MNLVKGTNCINRYVNEITKISDLKNISNLKRYKLLKKLASEWANEPDRNNITNLANQCISELLMSYLEIYKPLTFKGRLKRFIQHFNMFGR